MTSGHNSASDIAALGLMARSSAVYVSPLDAAFLPSLSRKSWPSLQPSPMYTCEIESLSKDCWGETLQSGAKSASESPFLASLPLTNEYIAQKAVWPLSRVTFIWSLYSSFYSVPLTSISRLLGLSVGANKSAVMMGEPHYQDRRRLRFSLLCLHDGPFVGLLPPQLEPSRRRLNCFSVKNGRKLRV